MHFKKSLAAIGLLGVAGLTAAGCTTATTSSIKATLHSTTEHVYGKVTGAAALVMVPKIPVTWTGPVNATGTFSPNNAPPAKGTSHTFVTSAGNLTVKVVAKPKTRQRIVNQAKCRFASVTEVPVQFTGGTAKFDMATGYGVFTFSFTGNLPKLMNGQCNMSNSATPTHAEAVFAGGGHLKVG